MWTTLACVAALSLAPSQGGTLTLKNPIITYGTLGAVRSSSEYLPGDVFFVSFDIDNVKVDETGKVLYSMQMEVTEDKTSKVWFKQAPQDMEAINALGGTTVPAFAHVNIGLDQPAGAYTMTVTVKDRVAKAEQKLSRKFEVKPMKFGLVRLQLSYLQTDTPERYPAPPLGVPGQMVYVNFVAVGFMRNAKKIPELEVQMVVKDEKGKPTLAKPPGGKAGAEITENFRAAPMQFGLVMNRSGKFTVELTATDKLSGQSSTLTFPLTVIGR